MKYRRGKTLAEKHAEQEGPERRKPGRKLTAAERKKVDQLRQKVAKQTAAGKLENVEIR